MADIFISPFQKNTRAVAGSGGCQLLNGSSPSLTPAPSNFFQEDLSTSSADPSCQLLASAVKLPLGGLPRDTAVRQVTDST